MDCDVVTVEMDGEGGNAMGDVGDGGRVGSKSEPGGKAVLMRVSSSQSSTNSSQVVDSLEICGLVQAVSQRSGAVISSVELGPWKGGGSGGGFGSVIIVAGA